MKAVICGAGQVGTAIASYLSRENNSITVVDIDPDHVANASDTLDVNGIVGHASYPDVLEKAGIADADMIIAVTASDEVNMVACQVAHSLFNVPKKIARIRGQSYRDPAWANLFSRYNMPIDVLIAPELEVASAIANRLFVPGTTNDVPLSDGRLHLIGLVCGENCPLIKTPLKQYELLFPDLSFSVMAVFRGAEHLTPDLDTQLEEGDEVYLLVMRRQLTRVLAAFGHHEQLARNIVIMGGGNVGLRLAGFIREHIPGVHLKVIEARADRAEYLSEVLPGVLVINGDGVTGDIMEEANIQETDTFVAVTQDDEENILGSLLAKQKGCKRTITLINKDVYAGLVMDYGIDAIVNPRSITVSNILQHVRRGRIKAVHSIRDGAAEVIEAQASETCGIVNHRLSEMALEKGIIVGAIVRKNGDIVIPKHDTRVQTDDRVILIAPQKKAGNVEKLFSFSIDLF